MDADDFQYYPVDVSDDIDHEHLWKVSSTEPYAQTGNGFGIGHNSVAKGMTRVMQVCTICGDFRIKSVEGKWKVKDFSYKENI